MIVGENGLALIHICAYIATESTDEAISLGEVRKFQLVMRDSILTLKLKVATGGLQIHNGMKKVLFS